MNGFRPVLRTLSNSANGAASFAYLRGLAVIEHPAFRPAFTLVVLAMVFAITSAAYAQATSNSDPDPAAINEAICWIIYFQRGAWGALLAATTGVSALVSAAMGNYKGSMSFLGVCIGCFMPEPLAELYFGTDALTPARNALGNGCVIATRPL